MQGRYTFIAIALLCLLPCAAEAQDQDGYDFRKTRWGMTPEEVKASESGSPDLEGDAGSGNYLITYEGSAGGMDATYAYIFSGGKLTEGAYYFNQERSDPAAYFEDYNQLKDKLTAKYGAPAAEKIVRGDNFYNGRPEDVLGGLAAGYVNYTSAWATRSTVIRLYLYNDGGKIKLAMLYTPNDFTKQGQKDEPDEANDF